MDETKYGDEADVILTRHLIVAPTGTDPGVLDDTDPGTIFLGGVNDPAPNPFGGGFLYVDTTGALKYKGPNGTITTVANP